MMNWYKQMQGQRIFVSRWDTRHYQAADGVASWDPASKSVTILVGGEDTDVAVNVLGLAARGLGPNVRVQLDYTAWTTDPNATNANVQDGGDPETGTFNLYDKTMSLDASGNLTIPINRMEGYDGYRIVISAAGPSGSYPTKYEAENAALNDVTVHSGTDGLLASGGAYVGGIDNADSTVAFTVNAPETGIYEMTVRYANGTSTADATHTLTIDGQSQGTVTYPYTTAGWSNTEMRTTTRRVLLNHGTNTIVFGKGNGYAELDYIDVRPDEHRYEAEYANVTDANLSPFDYDSLPDYVGGINNADSSVDFAIDAPAAGSYTLSIGYANATGSVSTHTVTVNGQSQGIATYQPTTAWLSSPAQDQVEKLETIPVTLAAGVNHVVLGKGTGYAELDDYVTLGVPTAADPPAAATTALANPNSGHCLDVSGSSTQSGAAVQLADCTNAASQQWRFAATDGSHYQLVDVNSGLCLAFAGDATAAGTPAVQETCASGQTAQSWQPVDLANGVTLLNEASGEALDVAGCATAAGATVQQWTSLENACQTFTYQAATAPPSGKSLVGQGSGRCLDIQNYGTADGTPVQLWDCSGNWNQKWQPTNGALINPQSGKCLDVAGGASADGTPVRLWTCNNSGAQQWTFNSNGTVTNPESGKCLDAVSQGGCQWDGHPDLGLL